jgi:cyanophycinase
MMKNLIILGLLIFAGCAPVDQDFRGQADANHNAPKGTLFIIGGGSRPDAMMRSLVEMAMDDSSYALIFSQSSSEPDTSFHYVAIQLKKFTDSPIMHIDSARVQNFPVDSIRKADMIYLTGGDQNRFIRTVPDQAIEAIREAYQNGATIAGTSAGAALMSEVMITGDQHNEPEDDPTYRRLEYDNAITTQGLGLLDSVVVDQHFVARSRYNRILSVMADLDYPKGAGIEESTALVVYPDGATVVGEGQVLIFSRPAEYKRVKNKIGFQNMNLNAYLEGDTFQLD